MIAKAKNDKAAESPSRPAQKTPEPLVPSIGSTTQTLHLKAGRYLIQHLGIEGKSTTAEGRVYPFAILFAPDRKVQATQIRFLGSDGENLARLVTPGDRTIIEVAGNSRAIFFSVFNAPGAQAGVRIGVKRLPAESPGAPKAPTAQVVAHLQDIGDQKGNGGAWIGLRDSRLRLEGFSISLAGFGRDALEYCASGADRNQKWEPAGTFVGSRGRAKALLQFGIRLGGELAKSFSIIYQGHFSVSGETKVFRDGELCGGSSKADFLLALRVAVVPRTAPAAFPSSAALNRIPTSDIVEVSDAVVGTSAPLPPPSGRTAPPVKKKARTGAGAPATAAPKPAARGTSPPRKARVQRPRKGKR